MEATVRYPVGQQSFERLREGGFLYVDKTRFIEKLVNGNRYYFLGRPRRFGKSLFLSTMKCFFQGKRELFKGLYADSMDWEWVRYPVLYLDVNIEKYKTPDSLEDVLDNQLRLWEEEYGVEAVSGNLSVRFSNVIRNAYEKTGRQVVILVDEYDKPLVNNLQDNETSEKFRDILSAFYSNFKSGADYLRLVMLTGVSRFARLSVFSGLNNINDISFDDAYSDICGISEDELHQNFREGIKVLSESTSRTEYETCTELKRRYDGYRFALNGKEMYNPYSLLSVMDKGQYGNYWIESGQPTLLMEQLKRFNVDLSELFHAECTIDDLKGLDLNSPNPEALLYQTGYLTIRSNDPATSLIILGIPNREVEEGFLKFLLPYYTNLHGKSPNFHIIKFVQEFRNGDVEGFMKRMQSLFSSITYDMAMDSERNLHNALLMLMMLIGLDVRTEYRTSQGRIDLFVVTERYYYIIELKLDGTAGEALRQINSKNYALPFATSGHEIIKIGVNFSRSARTITEWQTEELP